MSVLFSHNAAFLPVAKRLAAGGHEILSVDDDFARSLGDVDVAAKPLGALVDGELRDDAYREAARVLNAAMRPFSGDGLTPGVSAFLNDKLASYLYPRLADTALLVLMLDRARPGLVVLHNDVEPIMRLAALWAAANGVPCLHVPHAIYHDVNRGGVGSDVHDLITASHLAAAGPFQREWYARRGFPPERIRETGLPQFDRWTDMRMERARARRLLKVDARRPVVVYAGTWRQDTNLLGCHDEWSDTYLAFLEAMKRLARAQVVVKTHPRASEDSFKWHAARAQEAGVGCVLLAQHLEVVLNAADLVFAPLASNVLLEASFVPGARLMTTQGYAGDEAVLKVEPDATRIMRAVQEALSVPAPDVRDLQARYLGRADGRAGERVAGFAEELLCA